MHLGTRAACDPCLVRQQCAGWALASAQQHEIWGGMDEADLRLVTREGGTPPTLNPKPAPTAPARDRRSGVHPA
ncbi:WhiB family transcriptional regulator [Streptomyces sp900116325]|uniref:WhiB family transcriptional regulator n=1 Tax=Streptomyces sp. 900116325 TaxID=3154295 RepID=UPI0033B856BA